MIRRLLALSVLAGACVLGGTAILAQQDAPRLRGPEPFTREIAAPPMQRQVTDDVRRVFLGLVRQNTDVTRTVYDVAVRQQEAIGREEEARSGPAPACSARVRDVKVHDRRRYCANGCGDRDRIGVQQLRVGGRSRMSRVGVHLSDRWGRLTTFQAFPFGRPCAKAPTRTVMAMS